MKTTEIMELAKLIVAKGVPIKLRGTSRYISQHQALTVQTVYDALVELITNSDDSYRRLFHRVLKDMDLHGASRSASNGGNIYIELSGSGKRTHGKAYIIVRDNAEGMDAKQLMSLVDLGESNTIEDNRGWHGTGLRDCRNIGDVTIESIKAGAYSKATIGYNKDFTLIEDGRHATGSDRKRMRVTSGNGTSITIELLSSVKMPRMDSVMKDFCWHFSLREILDESSPTKVYVYKTDEQETRLVYSKPSSEKIIDQDYCVPGYNGARARFRLYKTSEPFPDISIPEFARHGILLKGKRAIYENSLLSDDIRRDPNINRFFGIIECDYIDILKREYDKRELNGTEHPSDNPTYLGDPTRHNGLNGKHPFKPALLIEPTNLLKEHLKGMRDDSSSHKFSSKVDDLTNMMCKFATEFLGVDDEDTGNNELWPRLETNGLMFWPHVLENMLVDTERTITIYAKSSRILSNNATIEVTVGKGNIQIIEHPKPFRQHKIREGILLTHFTIASKHPHEKNESSEIIATCKSTDNKLTADMQISVISRRMLKTLEFSKDVYYLTPGETISIKLCGKFPQVKPDDNVDASINKTHIVSLLTKHKDAILTDVGNGFCECQLTVRGNRIGRTSLSASVQTPIQTYHANVEIVVQDKRTPDQRQVRIKWSDAEPGNYPARWETETLLCLFRKHPEFSRILEYDLHGGKSKEFAMAIYYVMRDAISERSMIREGQMLSLNSLQTESDQKETVLARLQAIKRNCADLVHNKFFTKLNDW